MLCNAIFVGFCCFLLPAYVIAEERPRIIIIGSGAAGIAAASRLLQNGFTNLTILEAENRIGGRIHTTELGGYWVDVGGQWVHGEENNVAFELAWPLGLLQKTESVWLYKLFSSSGSMTPETTGKKLMEFYYDLVESEPPDEYLNVSIGEYYKIKFDEFFKAHREIAVDERGPLENMVDLFEMAHDAGDNWFNVSVRGLREYTRCPGDQAIHWKNKGYSTILDVLMKKIPNPLEELPVLNKTIYNSEVSRIKYNLSGGNVRVVTSTGDEYVGAHVILTASLGVLKSDHQTLFDPPLPEKKINAIRGLEFGTVAKIYLHYPEPWWDTGNGTHMFAFHWTKKDRDELAKDSEKAWLLGLFGAMRVENKPNLLCCWLSGPHARAMESVPEELVFDQTKEMLRRFIGKTYNLTEPTAMLRSQWYSNKHFRGTYSYRSLATERSGAMAIDLSEPITQRKKPILSFAGEATHPQYFSTVHGAIETGWREADRIIKYHTERKSTKDYSLHIQMSKIAMFRLALFATLCSSVLQVQAIVARSPRIVIIGAGASGIAAASRLLQNGFNNVTILEAENRIGGRVYTTRFGDYWVDVGGQWVHGEEDNVVYELAWRLGLLGHWDVETNMTVLSSSGSALPEAIASDLVDLFFNMTNARTPEEYSGRSEGDFYKLEFNERFDSYPELTNEQRKSLTQMFDLLQMTADAADSWVNVSAHHEDVLCPGDQALNWKDRGYSTILDILMKKFPDPAKELPVLNKTILNAEVSEIDYNVPHGVIKVSTTNGFEYRAEHVIVTVSLGVLKADHERMFNPPLPETKVNAIQGLQLGHVAKIFLLYPEAWWGVDNFAFFTIYWTEEDRKELENDPEKSWLLSIVTIVSVEHKPRLLSCWLAGPHAREMESKSEEQVFTQLKEIFHRFFGPGYNLTEPSAMLRSKWFLNKHFRGTWSYRNLETERLAATAGDLQEPIKHEGNPIVLFAGEATSTKHSSTVNGAIGSGWREANRLIKLYGRQRSTKERATEFPSLAKIPRAKFHELHSNKMFSCAIILALCCFLQLQADQVSPRIIIVGSGAAGIAAGTRLLENGFENVTILEAENRVGGRLYSTEFGGYTVDIGAEWVHGEKNNAVFEMVWPLGLLERSIPAGFSTLFDSAGGKMDEKTAADLLNFFDGDLLATMPAEEYKNRSLGDWYIHRLDEYFKGHLEIEPELREPLKKTFCLMKMAYDAADDWFDVAVDENYEVCEGDLLINWKNRTYGFVIDILLKKFPNPAEELPFRAKTILNTEVTKIDYDNPDGAVRVVTKNGDEYVADHVIVTPSLGVLKADHEKLFNPPLPETKVNAIKTIGFGSVAKIYLIYDEPWWPLTDSVMSLDFYWTDEDRKKVADNPEQSWLLGVFGIITIEHKPGLLCCWVTGSRVREMERRSEEQVFSEIKELLRGFLGKTYNLTEPKAMLRSQWHSNPHFRGTYSHKTPESKRVGALPAHIEEPIMENEKPKVMFAGEATSSHQYSTVHGAIRTGWREADRLMKHYGHAVTEKPKTT
ncbi:uncharacterized protein [Venturia canescens]|uniref:uncharacterized protein n=1 Tax=Venturia canescens TaxID=32260 RepID=UPI001C9D4A37|nr:uncharacterized protein LOC122405697 [Venturia canescens]